MTTDTTALLTEALATGASLADAEAWVTHLIEADARRRKAELAAARSALIHGAAVAARV